MVYLWCRFSGAALAFWPFLKGADKDVWLAGLELGLWSGLGYLLQAEGILTTDASRASFLSAFTVGLKSRRPLPVISHKGLHAYNATALQQLLRLHSCRVH